MIFSNSKGAYSESLGEIGITSMMYFSYNIYSYTKFMKNKEWSRQRNKTLLNKKLLIVGYGNNGICLAKIAKSGFEFVNKNIKEYFFSYKKNICFLIFLK